MGAWTVPAIANAYIDQFIRTMVGKAPGVRLSEMETEFLSGCGITKQTFPTTNSEIHFNPSLFNTVYQELTAIRMQMNPLNIKSDMGTRGLSLVSEMWESKEFRLIGPNIETGPVAQFSKIFGFRPKYSVDSDLGFPFHMNEIPQASCLLS